MKLICRHSFGRGIGNSPTIPIESFYHGDSLDVFLPLDLLVIGLETEARRAFFPLHG